MSKAGKLRVPDYLGHILEAIRRIHLYVEGIRHAKPVSGTIKLKVAPHASMSCRTQYT